MRATDLTKYIEGLTLTHGAKAGQPFRLLQWQRQFVKGMAKRGVYRAALSVPRGPGKTTLLAAVASAAIDGPLRVPRGEVVVVASSFEQSTILFRDMLAFVNFDAHDKDWRLHHSAQRAALEHVPSGCRVRCIASDPPFGDLSRADVIAKRLPRPLYRQRPPAGAWATTKPCNCGRTGPMAASHSGRHVRRFEYRAWQGP